MNRGCVVVLLNSVKSVMGQLESSKMTMDKDAYVKSMAELRAMKKLMEEMIDP